MMMMMMIMVVVVMVVVVVVVVAQVDNSQPWYVALAVLVCFSLFVQMAEAGPTQQTVKYAVINYKMIQYNIRQYTIYIYIYIYIECKVG